jgi:hypothetical protein
LVLKIIPFFDKYKIIITCLTFALDRSKARVQTMVGVKLQDYLDFKKVAELMRTKDHLTTSGLKKIKEISHCHGNEEGMNKKR